MNTTMENSTSKDFIRFFLIMIAATGLLLIPYVAMRFTNEVDWSAPDFIIAAVLLYGTGIAIEVALRVVKTSVARIAVCGAILLALFLVWAELAVGIFGTPFAGS